MSRYSCALLVAVVLLGTAPPRADEANSPSVQSATPPERTRLNKFLNNLGGNFVALFSKQNINPLLIGGGATGSIALLDDEIRSAWRSQGGSSTIGKIGAEIAAPYVVAPTLAGLLVAGHYSKNDRFRSSTYALAQTCLLNEALVQSLKRMVGRTRPNGSNNLSFPSGHTADSFAIATVVHQYYGNTAGIIGYAAASFVALSRTREDRHWASDLAASATIGYIVGRTVSHRTGISLRSRTVTFSPAVDPFRRRFGLQISIED